MSALNKKQMVIAEFELEDDPVLLSLVDSHWERFGSASDEYLRFLLTKRAIARALLSRNGEAADIQIGFDSVKASQIPLNYRRIINDITEEIDQDFPEYSSENLLTTLAPVSGYADEE